MNVQGREHTLLYGAGRGSVPVVDMMLDDFNVNINTAMLPGICLDCEPIGLASMCRHGHGIGKVCVCICSCARGEGVGIPRLV